DKYVWFYSEKINWWKGQVDSGVAENIKDVKKQITVEQNNTNPEIHGSSSIVNFRENEPNNYQGFHYTYERNSNKLWITLLDKNITIVEIYKNSRLIYMLNDPDLNFAISL